MLWQARALFLLVVGNMMCENGAGSFAIKNCEKCVQSLLKPSIRRTKSSEKDVKEKITQTSAPASLSTSTSSFPSITSNAPSKIAKKTSRPQPSTSPSIPSIRSNPPTSLATVPTLYRTSSPSSISSDIPSSTPTSFLSSRPSFNPTINRESSTRVASPSPSSPTTAKRDTKKSKQPSRNPMKAPSLASPVEPSPKISVLTTEPTSSPTKNVNDLQEASKTSSPSTISPVSKPTTTTLSTAMPTSSPITDVNKNPKESKSPKTSSPLTTAPVSEPTTTILSTIAPNSSPTIETNELSKAPKAESKAPKAESKAPKAETKAPKAETKAPKAETKVPKAESKVPKVESKAPKVESKAPKVGSKAPKAESSKAAPKVESSKSPTTSSTLSTPLPTPIPTKKAKAPKKNGTKKPTASPTLAPTTTSAAGKISNPPTKVHKVPKLSKAPTSPPTSTPTKDSISGTQPLFSDGGVQIGVTFGCENPNPNPDEPDNYAELSVQRDVMEWMYFIKFQDASPVSKQDLINLELRLNQVLFDSYISCPSSSSISQTGHGAGMQIVTTEEEGGGMSVAPIGVSSLEIDRPSTVFQCSSPFSGESCLVLDGSVTLLFAQDAIYQHEEEEKLVLNFIQTTMKSYKSLLLVDENNKNSTITDIQYLGTMDDYSDENTGVIITRPDDVNKDDRKRTFTTLGYVAAVGMGCLAIGLGALATKRRRTSWSYLNNDGGEQPLSPTRAEVGDSSSIVEAVTTSGTTTSPTVSRKDIRRGRQRLGSDSSSSDDGSMKANHGEFDIQNDFRYDMRTLTSATRPYESRDSVNF